MDTTNQSGCAQHSQPQDEGRNSIAFCSTASIFGLHARNRICLFREQYSRLICIRQRWCLAGVREPRATVSRRAPRPRCRNTQHTSSSSSNNATEFEPSRPTQFTLPPHLHTFIDNLLGELSVCEIKQWLRQYYMNMMTLFKSYQLRSNSTHGAARCLSDVCHTFSQSKMKVKATGISCINKCRKSAVEISCLSPLCITTL